MKKEIVNTVSEKLSLPAEAMSDIPLTQLRGKRWVCIENHRGLLEYTEEIIRVAVHRGSLTVKGRCLQITRMTKTALEIKGTIYAVEPE